MYYEKAGLRLRSPASTSTTMTRACTHAKHAGLNYSAPMQNLILALAGPRSRTRQSRRMSALDLMTLMAHIALKFFVKTAADT